MWMEAIHVMGSRMEVTQMEAKMDGTWMEGTRMEGTVAAVVTRDRPSCCR